MKQNKTMQILNHLKKYGVITSWDAIKLYKATRLSAIIFNLRKQHIIETDMQRGEDVNYARYIYKGERKSKVA